MADLLPQLFGEIVIPEPVFLELQGLTEFGVDVSWINTSPWIKIKRPPPSHLLTELLVDLDEGEAYAVALAVELRADLLIIDERKGRQAALALHLPITGLGGVLIRAKTFGLIPSVGKILDRVENEAGFYLGSGARNTILQAAGEGGP